MTARLCWVIALGLAGPATAEQDPLAYLERHGCMQAASDVGASWDEGYPVGAVEDYIQAQINAGLAVDQGAYTVLDPSICTVRLPRIETSWALDDPAIVALTTAVDEAPDLPGCFLIGLPEFFASRYADPATAHDAYVAFLGAHVLSGDLRFYTSSPVVTPVGWQVMTGACADVPEAEEIAASHAWINDRDFGRYVAYLRQNDRCFDEGTGSTMDAARHVQGIDPVTGDAPDGVVVNPWLNLEYLVITLAAGWRNGATMDSPGMSRPPLCAWP